MILPGKPIKENLYLSIPPHSLDIFRSLFGFLLCIELFFFFDETFFTHNFLYPPIHFTHPFLHKLGFVSFPDPVLIILYRLMQFSALGIMLGLLTRLSLVLFVSTFGYFFLMEYSLYTNHYYLILLLAFLLSLGHPGTTFSVDALIRKGTPKPAAYWQLFLLRFQIAIVYLFGAIAKMNTDWLVHGSPLYLGHLKTFSIGGLTFQDQWMAVLLSCGGMFLDLTIALLLIWNRRHLLTFVFLCLFNGLNLVLFGPQIQTFPYLMVASYILFLPPEKVVDWVAKLRSQPLKDNPLQPAATRPSRLVPAFVACYVLLQILMPLRHLTYKRNLLWTHEGSYFSWRMMADYRDAYVSLTIEDPLNNTLYIHYPSRVLSPMQMIVLYEPPIMLQYIDFLKSHLGQMGIKTPIIRAELLVSLNGRPWQHIFDPNRNLADVQYSPFKELDWILPLPERQIPESGQSGATRGEGGQ